MARLIDASGVVVFDGTIEGDVEVVRVPITPATTGLVVQAFPITAVDQGAQKFTIAGNHAALFPVGTTFRVTSSTGNDGTYTVASATFTTSTAVVTVEAIADATVDGSLNDSNGVGVEVYTPAVGDAIMEATGGVSVATGWDGSSPTLRFGKANATGLYDTSLGEASLDTPNQNASDGLDTIIVELPAGANKGLIFTTTDPVFAMVDDGNGRAPGSAAGEAEIILQIVKAS